MNSVIINIMLVTAWVLGLPVAFGIGLKSESGRIEFPKSISFSFQNVQIPFFNNVLGAAIAVEGNEVVVTSGLFQTAWKCTVASDSDISSDYQVSPTGSSDQRCAIYRPALVSPNFNPPQAMDLNSVNWGSPSSQNMIKGTFVSWASESAVVGFGWGRTVTMSSNGNNVAVGCPGCTGKSEITTTGKSAETYEVVNGVGKPLIMSGLVFEWNGASPLVVHDTSKRGASNYGPFQTKTQFTNGWPDVNGPVLNRDTSCTNSKNGCSFGMAVTYWNGDLFGSRSRTGRRLSRQDGVLLDSNSQPTGQCEAPSFGKYIDGGYCGFADADHFSVGEVIDTTGLTTGNDPENQLGGSSVYSVAGWGYKSTQDTTFKKISTPSRTPWYARVGQAMTTGNFYGGGTESLVVGAPGYGFSGAVLIFRDQTTQPGSVTGLRHPYKGATAVVTPGNDYIKSSMGHSLHTFRLDSTDQRDHLAVGAPTYQKGGVGGAVYLYKAESNGALSLSKILVPSDASPDNVNQRFGWSIASLDLNGDGTQDLVVGAPFNTLNCALGDPGSYCGAVYVFDGENLKSGNSIDVAQVTESSVVVGKKIFSMLGFAVAANNDYVFASEAGAFGSQGGEGAFTKSLLNAVNRGVVGSSWSVSPAVRFFSPLKTVLLTVTVGTVTTSSTSSASVQSRGTDAYTVDTASFTGVGQSFTVTFDLESSRSSDNKYYFVRPDVFASEEFSVTVNSGSAKQCIFSSDENPTSGLCKYDSNSKSVSITVERILAVDPNSPNELDRLRQDVVFEVVKVIDEADEALSAGSTSRAGAIINIDSTEPSNVEMDFDVLGGPFKLGQEIESTITVKNLRSTDDASLTLRVELDQVVYQFWKGIDLTSWSTPEAVLDTNLQFPVAFVTKRLAPVTAGSSVVVPLNFKLNKVNQQEITMRVKVFGSLLEDAVEKKIEIDDRCNPKWNSITLFFPADKANVAVDEVFEFRQSFVKSIGEPYYAQTSTPLNDTLIVTELDNRCVLNILSAVLSCPVGEAVTDAAVTDAAVTDYEDVPVDNNYVLKPDETAKGCLLKVTQNLVCQDNTTPIGGVSALPEPFANKIKFASYVEIPENVVEKEFSLITDFIGTGCLEVPSLIKSVVLRSQNQPEEIVGSSEISWWIYLIAILGALLLGAIVGAVLWKLGFFKRNKPPAADEAPGDVEGTVLRG